MMNTEPPEIADSSLDREQLKTLVNPISSILRNWCKLSDIEVEVLYNLGVGAYQKDNWQDASKIFAAAILLSPLNPVYLSAQAKCLKMMKDFDGAYQLFTLAQKLQGNAPEFSLHAAECLMLSGRKDEASIILDGLLNGGELPELNHLLRQKTEAWLNLLRLGKTDEPS